ncbi:hypothetical protein NLG97_g6619 [Lecanicillium saksenae]|uniref:Uncharacterized protein n=1 Tax=Lecanicillium saksenae TaxID=468837 RepID=A0ACC1QRQ9_9HYPO|nr:hypothetical protein NLG97_g6619 [Lecanicillium saksenae]
MENCGISRSPIDDVPVSLKIQMRQQLGTDSEAVFVLSPDGKTYRDPLPLRGVPVEPQEKKQHFRSQAEALGIRKTDRKNKIRQAEKVASDDCSKYAKIREIFGDGNGKYHPNQLVAKKYMPPGGLCEKELLYKFALKISNLQDLYKKQKLTMDPYDFYRWAICKNLKSDLHNAVNHTRNGLTGVIRTLGDDGPHADRVFRTIVLYWASLTGNENKFGKQKGGQRARRLGNGSATPVRNLPQEKIGLGGRDLALRISRLEMRRRRRHAATVKTAVYQGVNAHRAANGFAAKSNLPPVSSPSASPPPPTRPTAPNLSPSPAMFMQRTVIAAARRAAIKPAVARSFTTSFVRRTPIHFPAKDLFST